VKVKNSRRNSGDCNPRSLFSITVAFLLCILYGMKFAFSAFYCKYHEVSDI
jgi:hypothetical protein